MKKTKILVLGPLKVGKSAVANLVADHFDATTGDYYETRGVRIFELESYNVEVNGERVSAEVELWDCSGSDKYKNCWPAIRRDAVGIILICNPDVDSSEQLIPWYNEFVTKCGLTNDKVRIFLHRTGEHSNDSSIADFRIPPEIGNINCVLIDIDRGMDQLKLDFNGFLLSLVTDEPTPYA